MSLPRTRKYPRASATFTVTYTRDNETLRCKGSTLGGGGIFLDKVEDLADGSELLVQFRPTRNRPEVRARVRVAYTLPGQGAGLEFIGIDPEQRDLLLRLIHRKSTDRRESPRAPLATQVECDECLSLAFAHDISGRGMFLETKVPSPIGSRVSLRFNLDDGGPLVQTVAEVTYTVEKLGMGVLFVQLQAEDRKRLESYVAKSMMKAQAATT